MVKIGVEIDQFVLRQFLEGFLSEKVIKEFFQIVSEESGEEGTCSIDTFVTEVVAVVVFSIFVNGVEKSIDYKT